MVNYLVLIFEMTAVYNQFFTVVFYLQ